MAIGLEFAPMPPGVRRRVLFFCAAYSYCVAVEASPLVQLRLQAPSRCPSQQAIEQTLARLVRTPPVAPLQVSAHLAPNGEQWELIATLEGGQRVVSGNTCVELAEALVVIMALAIDPASPIDTAALQDFKQAQTTPPPGLATVPSSGFEAASGLDGQATARVSVPPLHQDKPDQLGLSLLLLGEWGALPGASLGPSIALRYGSPLRWGEFALSALYPRFAGVGGSKGARFGWFASQFQGCAAPKRGWPFAGCTGLELGDLFGYGVNTDFSQMGYAVWVAWTTSAVYRARLRGSWGVELRLTGAVPLTRPDFGLQGYGPIFEPHAASLRGLLGLSWH